jgi:4-hydroxy-tetrahydrodipicolinate reductase
VTELVRRTAESLGPEARTAIVDIHHKHKLDAPSGTALALAAAVKQGFENTATIDGREPEISSVREGEVIGEHTVSFSMPDEVIEITHKALDRDVFARGALQAGEWLVGKKPGLYSTADWLVKLL